MEAGAASVSLDALLARLTHEQRVDVAKAIGSTSVGLIGLPEMARHRRFRPAKSNGQAQAAPTVAERPFAVDDGVRLCQRHTSCTWMFAGYGRTSQLHESTRDLVLYGLRDITADAGLCGEVQYWTQGRDLFRGRSDVLFTYRADVDPSEDVAFLGAVLVCEEHWRGDVLDDPDVCVDVADVLRMLAAYHGVAEPLAIVSTYARWRLFWLDKDAADCGEKDSVNTATALPGAPAAGGRLCASATYDCCDQHLVRIIATAVHRMRAQSPRDSTPSGLVARVGVSLERVAWENRDCAPRHENNVSTHFRVSLKAAADFILTDDLGAGADGRAWRARPIPAVPLRDQDVDRRPNGRDNVPHGADGDNADVVIKFGHDQEDAEPGNDDDLQSGGCLWREALLWRRVWGVADVHTTVLCGRPALIMPYAWPVAADADEAGRTGATESVLRAIDHMAAMGLCHDDLRWRHVGKIAAPSCAGPVSSAETMTVFFDLARVSRRSPERAARRMKRALGLCAHDDNDDNDDDDSQDKDHDHDHNNAQSDDDDQSDDTGSSSESDDSVTRDGDACEQDGSTDGDE
ncbi:hypothetical protein pdul_cds_402 [Pandoravirus dulcis]|uniref:DUF5898 domain-containing protein n=1 Tax=Pandoravirus dulcis TaxID=1349409 RepID=S4VQ84_9VIRU|nr:hypothetical protein pdul_cds_402 [Pandoravirus dulcis]AGO82447.2 hypothetical protein pdul_cds_402 [Pandoravirus dulcis]